MFKLFVLSALVAMAVAAPKPGIIAAAPYAAVPAPFVTAASSQVIARNYNTLAAAPLAYSAPLAYTAPLAAAPLAYSAPGALAYSTHAVAPAAYSAYAAAAPAFYSY